MSSWLKPTSRPAGPNRRWLILGIVAIAQLMVVLDATIVNIALPHAQRALHISETNRQWVVTAYALAFGGLLLLGGRIADYGGRRRAFLIGLIGFAGASALGAGAVSGDMLFAARALQGAFGALLAPAALSVLTTTFEHGADRAKAFAVYGSISAGGAAVGLLLGGILTQYLSWRWTLLVNAPIAIAAIFAAARFVPESRAEGTTRYDVPGAASVTAGLVAIVYGFTRASTDGWGSSTTLGLLAAGVVLLAAFVAIELRSTHPLLPMRIPLDRNRGGSYLAAIAVGGAMLGTFVFLSYYLQLVKHYSPVKTGLAVVPISGIIIVAAVVATKLLPRLGPRLVMSAGGVIGAGGMLLLAQTTVSSSYVAHILPAELVLGFGMGLVFIPLQNTATHGVDPNDAGAASALTNASQQIGGALGTALFNTFYTVAVASYLAANGHGASTLPHALVHGYDRAFSLAAAAILLAAIVAFSLIRGQRRERQRSDGRVALGTTPATDSV